ncbi:MAG: hypothetical protein ACE5K9_00005 [Candidatus Methylomirabilales bacterium]
MGRKKAKVGYDGADLMQLLTFDAHTRRQLKSYMGNNGDLVAELEHWAALFKTWSAQEARPATPDEMRMALGERYAAVTRLRLLLGVTDVDTSDLIATVLLEQKHPDARLFLRRLELQLNTLSHAIQMAQHHKSLTPGQPRETTRRFFARQVALTLQTYGIEVTPYPMGTFGRVLGLVLRATGASLGDLRLILKQAVEDIQPVAV